MPEPRRLPSTYEADIPGDIATPSDPTQKDRITAANPRTSSISAATTTTTTTTNSETPSLLSGQITPPPRKAGAASTTTTTTTKQPTAPRWHRKLQNLTTWLSTGEPSVQALRQFKRDTFAKASVALDDPRAAAKLHLPVGVIPDYAVSPTRGPEPEELVVRRRARRMLSSSGSSLENGRGGEGGGFEGWRVQPPR